MNSPRTSHPSTSATAPESAPREITVSGLVKIYGATSALAGVDLRVAENEIFGILGPNGAGKSTLIETLAGLRTPTAGQVRVLGFDPVLDPDRVHEVLGLQPQHAELLPQQTVAEVLRLWASLHRGSVKPEDILRSLGLQGERDVRIKHLSGGQRQRALVATALTANPRVLVLDEPSSGLDPNARRSLWQAIREHQDRGNCVLLSTHSMEEAEALCDRIAIIDRGEVVACGTPSGLVAKHAPEQSVSFTVPALEPLRPLLAGVDVSGLRCRSEEDGIRVSLRTESADRLLADVLTATPPATRAAVQSAGLDAVFQHLTGRAFDDSDETGKRDYAGGDR